METGLAQPLLGRAALLFLGLLAGLTYAAGLFSIHGRIVAGWSRPLTVSGRTVRHLTAGGRVLATAYWVAAVAGPPLLLAALGSFGAGR